MRDIPDNARAKKTHTPPVNDVMVFPKQLAHSAKDLVYEINGKTFFPASAPALARAIEEHAHAGGTFDNRTSLEWLSALTSAARPRTPMDAPSGVSHYQLPGLGIEWIDVREAIESTIPSGTDYRAVGLWHEAITYLARMWQKNGVEDAKKAAGYLARMIDLMKLAEKDHDDNH